MFQDAFTQCTLQNLLVSFQREVLFSPRLCEDALGVSLPQPSLSSAVDSELASVLQQLIRSSSDEELRNALQEDYSNPELPYQEDSPLSKPYILADEAAYGAPEYGLGNEIDLLGSNKRDEFVQVHKYFDKSKGQLKRDPFLAAAMMNEDPYNFITAFPQKTIPGEDPAQDNELSFTGLDDNTIEESVPVPYGPLNYNAELDGPLEVYDPDSESEALFDDEEDGGQVEEAGQFFDLPPGEVEVVGPDQEERLVGGEDQDVERVLANEAAMTQGSYMFTG